MSQSNIITSLVILIFGLLFCTFLIYLCLRFIKEYRDSKGKKPDFLWDIRTKSGMWQYANPNISQFIYKNPVRYWTIIIVVGITFILVIVFLIFVTLGFFR
jgi:uncharacterized membrane protein SpoIIM required for sporulation